MASMRAMFSPASFSSRRIASPRRGDECCLVSPERTTRQFCSLAILKMWFIERTSSKPASSIQRTWLSSSGCSFVFRIRCSTVWAFSKPFSSSTSFAPVLGANVNTSLPLARIASAASNIRDDFPVPAPPVTAITESLDDNT